MVDSKSPVGELEYATQRSLRVPGSRDGRYRFRQDTIDLQIEPDEGGVVVSDGFSTVSGTREDVDAAIADYVDELYAYFEKLERREAMLACGLRAELAALRRYINLDA